MEAKQKLEKVIEILKEVVSAGKNLSEADTKAHFIDKYLDILGYHGLEDVQREFYIRESKEYIDYLLKANGKKIAAIEAKALQVNLTDSHAAQLIQYAAIEGIEWCILTNAKQVIVYNQYNRGNLKDKLVLKLDLLESEIDEIFNNFWLLSKEQMALGGLENLQRQRILRQEIKYLLTDETSSVIKKIRQEIKAKHGLVFAPSDIAATLQAFLTGKQKKHKQASTKPLSAQDPSPVSPEAKSSLREIADTKKEWSTEKLVNGGKRIKLRDLYIAGIVSKELDLFGKYKGQILKAKLTPEGIVMNGRTYASPSAASNKLIAELTGENRATNGWVFWKFADSRGEAKSLKTLRDKLPGVFKNNTNGFYY